MADKKITELDALETPVDADVLPIVDDPAGTPVTKKVTWANVKATLKDYFDTLYQALGTYLSNVVEDESPQLGGDLDLNDKQIKLKFEPADDLTASGLIVIVDVGYITSGIGTPLMIAPDEKFYEADASNSGSSPCVVLSLHWDTGMQKVLVHGIMRKDSWNWTTGPGAAALIYVAPVTGVLTQTKPSGTDQVVAPVGWAISADCIYFCPSMMYFTHV